jgi:phage terminase large subunit GpA-like protein
VNCRSSRRVSTLATVRRAGFVLDYCRARRGVIAIKGQSQPGKPVIGAPKRVDVNVRGVVEKRGAKLWPVGSDTIKGVLMARLQDEGFVHFCAELPSTYFSQLVAERLVTKFTHGIPHKVWVKASGARNEALDCFVYAYAAAVYAGLKRKNWAARRIAPAPATDEPAGEAPAPQIAAKRRSRSSWMRW